MKYLYYIILGVISYLIGNISSARIVAKHNHGDITKHGSGNPGTLNTWRAFGFWAGVITFLLDMLKGVIPTLAVYFVFQGKYFPNSYFIISDFAIYLCGFCVVMGHIYPIVFKFKGGKGIASTIGVFLVCESVYGIEWAVIIIMALVAALVFIYLTEFGAMGSFIAITPPAIGSLIRLFNVYGNFKFAVAPATTTVYVITNSLVFAICFFTWFAHRHNIERMLSGDEHPTSIKEMVVKMKAKKALKSQEDKNNQKSELADKKN